MQGTNDSPKVMQLELELGLEFSLFGALALLTFFFSDGCEGNVGEKKRQVP